MAKVAMLVGQDFEDSEFSVPFERLREAGHEIVIVGSKAGASVSGKQGQSKARIEQSGADALVDDYDALVIPGGYGPDHLRMDDDIVGFTRAFVASGKPVAAICHGPQLLIEAEAVRGMTLTSWPSVRKDLINAGAEWVGEPVVEDGNLITSRNPDDLPVFCDTLLQRLEAGKSSQAAAS
ncbi:MAG: type 1 glutamine amidotransferase domain-containing protein [Thiogranum sp.]|nr:type 1 glutamine amidotransferase domain-containing protein [Thiogranum sp.]